MLTSLNVLHNSFPPYVRKVLLNAKCISLGKHLFCRDIFNCYDIVKISHQDYFIFQKHHHNESLYHIVIHVVDLGFLCTITYKIQYYSRIKKEYCKEIVSYYLNLKRILLKNWKQLH